MSKEVEQDIHLRIEMILSRSRYEDELFLINPKTVSTKIIELFKEKNLLAKEVSVFEVSY